MTLTRASFAEKVAAVERHLARVAARLPGPDEPLEPSTDASDAVILHGRQSRVRAAATEGPADLRAFLAAVRDALDLTAGDGRTT